MALLGALALDGLSRSPRWQTFGQVLSHGDRQQPLVALSFDDGPNPRTTPQLLEVLRRTGTKASFFLVGRHIVEHPQLAEAIVAAGQEVGNHSFSHDPMVLERPWRYRREIARTDGLIRGLGYHGVIRFRPPYGRKLLVLPWLLARQGRLDVLWDVNPQDWTVDDPMQITERVLAQVRPGSIVVLHEHPATVEALEPMIRQLRQRGYRLVGLEELIGDGAPAALSPSHRLPSATKPAGYGPSPPQPAQALGTSTPISRAHRL
ncbi:MAG: polysaccharide deacetylase family protein [Synechococcaceae cyanobacterium]